MKLTIEEHECAKRAFGEIYIYLNGVNLPMDVKFEVFTAASMNVECYAMECDTGVLMFRSSDVAAHVLIKLAPPSCPQERPATLECCVLWAVDMHANTYTERNRTE
jgi:hypothetical protein